jgi:hypothetical protein
MEYEDDDDDETEPALCVILRVVGILIVEDMFAVFVKLRLCGGTEGSRITKSLGRSGGRAEWYCTVR